MPAPPMPAMARPMMRMKDVGAAPHRRLPTSNTMMEDKKVVLRGKYLYALPQVDWKPAVVMKNAELYQETSAMPWNSSVIFGIAVATIVYKSNQLPAAISFLFF